MAKRIEELTIVGGGTAGWLSALIFTTLLNQNPKAPPVKVTLIESPKVPTIGVGEATVQGITQLLRLLGLSETEFMRRTNATFKLAAEFVGWNQDAEGKPIYFLHPFNFPPHVDGVSPAYHLKRFGSENGQQIAEALTWNQAIITAMKGPRPIGGKDYEAVVAYAYHLDAGLFGQFLREVAIERGVRHILDDVLDAEVNERGHIAALQLEENGRFPVKLVVDCTGFRSVLLQDKLGERFIPYSNHLLCDRAMPAQIPVPSDKPLPCATRATALSGGWCFRVPLAERIGSGYIYSSAFKSDDEARAELIAHWRAVGDLTPDMPDPEPRVIEMRTGRTERAWVGNCVAIGLSNGFVEPLEATAIYMIESASRWLLMYYPDEHFDPALAHAFNRRMDNLYNEVRDFLSMHFVTSNRPEPFWQAARAEGVAPERLMENLALWKQTMPSDQDMFYKGLFSEWNYLYCLWPKGFFDKEVYPLSAVAQEDHWRRFEADVRRAKNRLLETLPDHRALLRHIRGEEEPAVKPAAAAEPQSAWQIGGISFEEEPDVPAFAAMPAAPAESAPAPQAQFVPAFGFNAGQPAEAPHQQEAAAWPEEAAFGFDQTAGQPAGGSDLWADAGFGSGEPQGDSWSATANGEAEDVWGEVAEGPAAPQSDAGSDFARELQQRLSKRFGTRPTVRIP